MKPPSGRRGTLASIAAELGVSRTTVSNAYNRPDQMTPELRARILKTADRMGYPGPDPMARSLRTRHAGAIGVLLTEDMTYAFDDQASLDFVSGVSVACGMMDSSLLLIPAGVAGTPATATNAESTTENTTDADTADAATSRAARLVGQASVDGFIVYSVAADDPYLAEVRHRGLPMVVCDQPRPLQPDSRGATSFVGINDREAIKPAARAIIDAGHKHIGVLCIRLDREPNDGPVSRERLLNAHMDVQRERVLGVLEELAAAGIDATEVPIIERHINTRATARAAAQELLEIHPELTAVVCTTDSMALGVAEYCDEQGIDIPERVSVTGFDGIAQAVARGITTVAQPSKDKGYQAGMALARQIEQYTSTNTRKGDRTQEQHPVAEILETWLVPGDSVAPPRS